MRQEQTPFIARHPIFKHPLPEGHRFPMLKYELLPEKLLLEGVITKSDFFTPEPLHRKFLKGIHDADYVEKLFSLSLEQDEIRRIGLPLSEALMDRELTIACGTVKAAKAALKRGIGFNIAGGTHHAGTNWGEGFCLLNDQAVAAGYLLNQIGLKRILIIDLDVHQGNGTADIFKNEDRVFTFSMHGENNFPFKKERSDWDVGLPDETGGAEYLQVLAKKLNELYTRSRPDFVFYQAGADVLETDKLGRLNLSIEDCRQRDMLVFQFCKKWQLPVQVSMGGGYSANIKDIVQAHSNTYKAGISALLK
ncbi:MAG TPA: histone deacetylase [Balneolaceae bacterium]|nr:histone deacetylase [Balneolaceae bacterium]